AATRPERRGERARRAPAAADRAEDERCVDARERRAEPAIRPRQVPCQVERFGSVEAAGLADGEELPRDVADVRLAAPPRRLALDVDARGVAGEHHRNEMDPLALRD